LSLQTNISKPNGNKTTALYCNATIKNIEFPLIVDSGSAGSIISLNLLKELDMEITHASKTLMVNVNGERRRPLGAVNDIPLKIEGHMIPMSAIVTEADSYSAIVGNDWLRKSKALIDYYNNEMILKWNGQEIHVPIECQEMPHHIISIEVPEMEDEVEDEDEEEESEEEYESEGELQEQMYCHTKYITQEEAQEIEIELELQSEVESECFYQYEETTKGKFHQENLNEEQQQKFASFIQQYHDLFA
jgi:hypothetical protein